MQKIFVHMLVCWRWLQIYNASWIFLQLDRFAVTIISITWIQCWYKWCCQCLFLWWFLFKEKFFVCDNHFDLTKKTYSIHVYLIEAVWSDMIKTLTHQISVLQSKMHMLIISLCYMIITKYLLAGNVIKWKKQ